MKTISTISANNVLPISNESINLLDLLRVIGMEEVANNVFTIPSKKKK